MVVENDEDYPGLWLRAHGCLTLKTVRASRIMCGRELRAQLRRELIVQLYYRPAKTNIALPRGIGHA